MSSHDHHSHVIVPTQTYFAVYVALLVLTIITVAVAQFDFGSLNIVIALFVAFIKASLVACVFMGLYWDKGFNRILILVSILFIALFLGLSAADVFARGSLDPRERGIHDIKSPVKPLSSDSGHGAHSESGHH